MTRTWLAPRLLKEARPLFWPWCIAVVASLAALYSSGEFAAGVRAVTLCTSVALLAALSFGSEFQQRTLPLLLSQPIERSRLWREKFFVLAFGGGLVLALNCGTWLWQEHFGFWDLLFLGLGLLATVTSSGLWISITRSVAVGIACGILNQVLVFGGFIFGLRKLYEHSPLQVAIILQEHKPEIWGFLTLYAFSFLWFGRRFWKGKLRAFALAAGVITLVLCLGRGLVALDHGTISNSPDMPFEYMFMFVFVTVCSAGFWTLTARSTIGGLVFCVASQVLAGMVLVFGVSKVCGVGKPHSLDDDTGPLAAVALGAGALVYSGLFLWLGWRKFARMELRDAVFGEGVELSAAEVRSWWWSRWLVCRPHSNFLNLLRKEVRLQKPVFLSAAMFLVCWAVGLVLYLIWPEQGYNHFLELLPMFYVPLALILAGCVSLGDEKTLGVAAWQLTLPVSARRLWFVKLGVANVTGLALGVVLPCLMILVALATGPTEQISKVPQAETMAGLMLVAWPTILVSFGASTIVGNVIRAALTTMAALAVGAGCVALGIWGAAELPGADGGLQTGLLTSIMVHCQLPPSIAATKAAGWVLLGTFLVGVAAIALLLGQSLALFRRAERRRETVVKYSFLLGVITLCCAFWDSDFMASAEGLGRSQPATALQAALCHFSAKESLWNDGKPRVVTLAELKQQTTVLSPVTEAWLRDTVITLRPVGNGYSGAAQQVWLAYFQASILFPNGRQYEFGYTVSVPPKPNSSNPGKLPLLAIPGAEPNK
ncbi:MAG TPA: hypothetical protein VN578_17270 [Candidatus Binatia bacterium]|nr:hypothetical protein [Candidatus Binatia bacterium]